MDVFYTVEQDEDGKWCASAQIVPGVAAFGDGSTPEAAVADLGAGWDLLIEELRENPSPRFDGDVSELRLVPAAAS